MRLSCVLFVCAMIAVVLDAESAEGRIRFHVIDAATGAARPYSIEKIVDAATGKSLPHRPGLSASLTVSGTHRDCVVTLSPLSREDRVWAEGIRSPDGPISIKIKLFPGSKIFRVLDAVPRHLLHVDGDRTWRVRATGKGRRGKPVWCSLAPVAAEDGRVMITPFDTNGEAMFGSVEGGLFALSVFDEGGLVMTSGITIPLQPRGLHLTEVDLATGKVLNR